MKIQYDGIALAMTGADVPFSATPLWAWDAIVTAAQVTTLKGANGVIMARLESGIPFQIPGASHREWGDEPQVDLGQYSANAVAGTVNIAFSQRRT